MYDLLKVEFTEGMVIHCNTEEKAKILLDALSEQKYRWGGSNELEEIAYWKEDLPDVCFWIEPQKEITHGDLKYAHKRSDIVTEFDDLPNLQVINDQEAKTDTTTRKSVLEQAEKTVCVDREKQYGSPENNFKLIAKLWSVVLGITITPKMVAIMMNLLKVARIISGQHKTDNWVDALGYMACGAELEGLE